jgi:hypothetical protein
MTRSSSKTTHPAADRRAFATRPSRERDAGLLNNFCATGLV